MDAIHGQNSYTLGRLSIVCFVNSSRKFYPEDNLTTTRPLLTNNRKEIWELIYGMCGKEYRLTEKEAK